MVRRGSAPGRAADVQAHAAWRRVRILSFASSASGSNGSSAAQEVDDDPQEEGSPGTAREADREEGRTESGAAQQIADARQRPVQDGGRVKASPLARRIARERGIERFLAAGASIKGAARGFLSALDTALQAALREEVRG